MVRRWHADACRDAERPPLLSEPSDGLRAVATADVASGITRGHPSKVHVSAYRGVTTALASLACRFVELEEAPFVVGSGVRVARGWKR